MIAETKTEKKDILTIAEEYEKIINRHRSIWTQDDINSFAIYLKTQRMQEDQNV